MLRLGRADLEIGGNQATKLPMIEQEIDIEILSADLKVILATDEGKALIHLQQQVSHACDESAFEVALLGDLGKAEEIELVGVLQDLLGKIGASRRQRTVEIRDDLPLAIT